MSELALLRKRGLAILAVMSWLSTAWLLLMGWQLQSDNLGIVLFLAIGVNIGPTLMALSGQQHWHVQSGKHREQRTESQSTG